jgi:hypothetical protein
MIMTPPTGPMPTVFFGRSYTNNIYLYRKVEPCNSVPSDVYVGQQGLDCMREI